MKLEFNWLGIAQIEALDLIKVFDFARLGYFGSFRIKIRKPSNLDKWYNDVPIWYDIPKWSSCSGGYEKLFPSHLTKNWGYFGQFAVKIQIFSNFGMIYQYEAFVVRLRTSGCWGHFRRYLTLSVGRVQYWTIF